GVAAVARTIAHVTVGGAALAAGVAAQNVDAGVETAIGRFAIAVACADCVAAVGAGRTLAVRDTDDRRATARSGHGIAGFALPGAGTVTAHAINAEPRLAFIFRGTRAAERTLFHAHLGRCAKAGFVTVAILLA